MKALLWNHSCMTLMVFLMEGSDLFVYFVRFSTCLNLVTEMSAIKSDNYHHILFLTTGQLPLPTRFIHGMRSSASCFNFQHPLLFSRSSSSCLRLLPSLPISFIFHSITCFRRHFPRNMWPIQLASIFLLYVRYSFLSWLSVILHFSHDRSNWSSSFSSTTFQNFPSVSFLLSSVSRYHRHFKLCSKCGPLRIS